MDSSIHRVIHFNQELLNLIKEGEFERTKEILENSFYYNTVDESGATLLHYSAQYNNEKSTKHLLDKGCDINIQDAMGNTPLMIAVSQSCIAIVKILLAAGADIFKSNSKQKSALHILATQYAVGDINQLFLQELKKKCSTSDEIANKLIEANFYLYQAVFLKDAYVTEYMLKKGSPVNSKHPTYRITALHIAVRLDDLKSMIILLKYGADINALDAMDESPLCNVYRDIPEHSDDKIEMLKILINRGASMMSCVSNGIFQVGYLLTQGNREAVRMLIESGLDFSAKDNQSHKNVLHYFASNENPEIVEELKIHVQKFNVNVPDKFGQTPLFTAVGEGNVEMVKFLLKQGAKTDIKHNIYGTTPLYYAYKCTKAGYRFQYRQCGELLLQYNADPQFIVVKESGEVITIFEVAMENGDFKKIKSVLAHLAMLDKCGTPISEIIQTKINSYDLLKEYFQSCQKLLVEEICGYVKLFHLFTCDKKKMARYLSNDNVDQKVQDKIYRCKMLNYVYYYNVLNRRYFEGIYYKKLRNKAALLISKIFQYRICKTHLIIESIVTCLDDISLRNLSLLYYQLRRRSFPHKSYYQT